MEGDNHNNHSVDIAMLGKRQIIGQRESAAVCMAQLICAQLQWQTIVRMTRHNMICAFN